MLCYILLDQRANNIHLQVPLFRPQKSILCQRRCYTDTPQPFGNFGVNQLKDIPAQTVLKIGDLAVTLNFESASRYFLELRLTAKESPHDRYNVPFLRKARLACVL